MSAKLALYNAIKAKVIAMKDDSDNLIVKTFGHWNNQFARINEEKQFRFPAVYVQFNNIDWKTDTGMAQQNRTQQARGVCNLTIHIGIENKKDEDDSFPEDIVIIDSIYDQLNGLDSGTTGQFTPLARTGEIDDNDKNNIRSWAVNYVCTLHEKGYAGTDTDATVGGTVEIKIATSGNYV